MFKLVVLSVVLAAAQAGYVAPAGLAYNAYAAGIPAAAYAGAPLPAAAYAGAYAAPAYAGAYAAPAYAAPAAAYAAAPVAAAPVAAPVAYAAAAPAIQKIEYPARLAETIVHEPVPQNYAVPAPRDYAEAPIIEQALEKVEQHGYSVRY